MKKLTPVLFVEAIEPCLPFWVERLRFDVKVEIPAGDGIGFVILVKDDVEVMLQSRASIAGDVPALAKGPFAATGVTLYLEVADLAPIRAAVKGCEIVIPGPKTVSGPTRSASARRAGSSSCSRRTHSASRPRSHSFLTHSANSRS